MTGGGNPSEGGGSSNRITVEDAHWNQLEENAGNFATDFSEAKRLYITGKCLSIFINCLI